MDLTNSNFLDEGFSKFGKDKISSLQLRNTVGRKAQPIKPATKKVGDLNATVSVVAIDNSKKSTPMNYYPANSPQGDRLEDEVFNTHENEMITYNPNELIYIYSPEWWAAQRGEYYADIDGATDNKIMGVNKTAFYVGLSAVILIGGYLGYKKYLSKK